MFEGSQRTVYGGMRVSNTYIDELVQYGKKKEYFRFICKYQYGDITVLRVISDKFDYVSEKVDGYRIDYWHKDELPWRFTPSADSNDDDASKKSVIKLTNSDSSVLHVNNILMVRGLFTNLNGLVLKTVMDGEAFLPESVLVTNIGADNSAGAGYREIVVERMHPNLMPTAPLQKITSANLLLVCGSIAGENSMPFPASSVNKWKDYNYVGTHRKSFGISSHIVSGIDMWVNENDPLGEEREDAQGAFVKERERHLFVGRRSEKTVGGLKEYETGGIFEGIPNTPEHPNWLNFNNTLSIYNLEKFVDTQICQKVGSDVSEFWMFPGTTLAGGINHIFEGKVGLTKAEGESLRYGLNVVELDIKASSTKFFITPAPIMNDFGFADKAIILNLSQKHRCWQLATKTELQEFPKGDKSLTPDGQRSIVHEFFLENTLFRRLGFTNFAMYGVGIPD